ncbi:MAG: DUF4173 domain-containing protein [Alphaproteobacteria bacterium]
MTSLSETRFPSWVAAGNRWRRPLLMIGLIALADWLFFGHMRGLSVVVFAAALAAGALIAWGRPVSPGRLAMAGAVLVAAAVPAVLAPAPLAVAILALATAHFALAVTSQTGQRLSDRIGNAAQLLAEGSWRWAADAARGLHSRGQRSASPIASAAEADGTPVEATEAAPRRHGVLVAWIVPLALGATFLLLFRSANPLIEDWLDGIDLGAAFANVSPVRLVFWLAVVALVWPFVFLKRRSGRTAVAWAVGRLGALVPPLALPAAPPAGGDGLFGKRAILRSLILFNLLFAVQTLMDLAYLWGGLALPDGMTYAAYAHRGAYPLIATALLAAVFVLAAMRPGSETAQSRSIRLLVFLWVGQNVLLVASSMLRLDLYVAVYSLTYLRIAAFIWMLLVALGLVLIVARIAFHRSNGWLFGMNLIALSLALYLCGFVNFPRVIADYNVAHSREVSGEGTLLDIEYLRALGPQAIPALDRYRAALLARDPSGSELPADEREGRIDQIRAALVADHRRTLADWRAWNYRSWQLERELERAVGYDGAR